MNHPEYTKSRDLLINAFENEFQFRGNEVLNCQFHLVSASLSNFVPSIPFSSHEKIYKRILLHKKLSILEQGAYHVLDLVETENLGKEMISLMKNKGGIICTFHTGSYRVINLLLARHQIPFTLVIGKDIAAKEGEMFSSLFNHLPGNNENSNFEIINAEDPKAGLQMLRELKQGRTLVLYIDGNTGGGTNTMENENRCAVNFLNQQLFARKGISFLAHVANVPIVSVVSWRPSWEAIRLRFFDPVFPDTNKERDAFARETTQQIYDLATPIIQSYPEQWEGWLYLHKTANVINPVNINQTENQVQKKGSLQFNTNLFGVLMVNGTAFLLNKNTYSFYEIDQRLYQVLTECVHQPVKRERFENNLFMRLYEQGVLLYL
jgi:lauroyl/myristoyl acyltransferase